MENQKPTIGRIVLYRLRKEEIEVIERRRSKGIGEGNPIREDSTFPMIIVRVWGETPESCVNGRVLLDGNDSVWATSVSVGEGPGTFSWPKKR